VAQDADMRQFPWLQVIRSLLALWIGVGFVVAGLIAACWAWFAGEAWRRELHDPFISHLVPVYGTWYVEPREACLGGGALALLLIGCGIAIALCEWNRPFLNRASMD
jgi:hypothetical protein